MPQRWKHAPAGSNWGEFGPDDQRGRMNLVDRAKVLQGIAEVREGLTFCLSLPLDVPGGMALNPRRLPPQRYATLRDGKSAGAQGFCWSYASEDPLLTDVVCDDVLLMNTQYSTQWDSLAHMGSRFDADGDGEAEAVFYNGYRAGIDIWPADEDPQACADWARFPGPRADAFGAQLAQEIDTYRNLAQELGLKAESAQPNKGGRQMTYRIRTRLPGRRAALMLAAALPLLACGVSQASDAWPSRPVRVVVPYGPGGAVDVATRKMAQMLSTQTGQSFIVENKPGATGTIGVSQVARAAPDGYTLVANDTTYSLLPHIFKQLPFDPAKDLQPISAFVFAPMALAVSADSPYRKLDDLIAQARAKPDFITYGSGGPGTTPHFAAEGLALATNVKFMHVPFKGAAEATQAVLGKVIDFQFASTTGIMGAVQGGQLRLLAVSGDKRLAVLPEVLTFTEAGVKDFGVVNWTGLWAPKGTPTEVTERLQREIAKAMAGEDMQTFATKMGAEPRAAGAAEFGRILADSGVMWGNVARSIGYDAK